jgi:hypothetical protein
MNTGLLKENYYLPKDDQVDRVKKRKAFRKPLMKTKIELRKSKHINFFMKRLMLFSGLFLITSISSKVFAEKGGHYQQAPKDSIPKKIIGKVKITVKI